LTVDGHDEAAIDHAIERLWSSSKKSPKALIAKTVKGKGVSFMENNNLWHYTRLNPETYTSALHELEAVEERVK
jgi:transketolase